MSYVQCSVCGKKVSNIVSEELYIRAYIECPECIIDTHKSDNNREAISHELCAKGRLK